MPFTSLKEALLGICWEVNHIRCVRLPLETARFSASLDSNQTRRALTQHEHVATQSNIRRSASKRPKPKLSTGLEVLLEHLAKLSACFSGRHYANSATATLSFLVCRQSKRLNGVACCLSALACPRLPGRVQYEPQPGSEAADGGRYGNDGV